MAKRSKQRHVRQNKDQAGCMWGLISMFDFRHGRTTRRLLSDRRHMAEKIVGLAYPTSEENLLAHSEENHNGGVSEKPKFDVVKPSVKELMEEEMFGEQGSKKQIDVDEVERDVERGSHVKKTHKKTSKKTFDDCEIAISHQVPSQKVAEYHDLEALKKELLLMYQKKSNWLSDLDVGANTTSNKELFEVVDENLNAAVEALMNEKSGNGDEGRTRHSKDLVDSIQMLTSNKELFLKLLQDQNSLMRKHIQGSEDVDANANEDQKSKSKSKSIARSSSMEIERTDPRSEEPVTRKHRNFFRRRSKSQENVSLKGNDSPVHSSRIVILKPNSPDYRLKTESPAHSERSGSQFSFVEIKKRLKQAMGKEQRSEKTVFEGSSGWSSPNRDHFYTERFAKLSNGPKRGERVSKLRESETRIGENGDTSHRISDIYIEAKKHLSEMLSNGDEDAQLLMGSLPKTLGRILSFPEYTSLSHGGSPRKESETVNESQPRSAEDNLEEKVQVPIDEDTSCQVVLETVKSPSSDVERQEEVEIFDVSCEPCSMDEDQGGEIVEVFDEPRSSHCSKEDSREENKFSSPASSPVGPSIANKAEELESSSSDKIGRPSPVSVLEPLFSDNDISPASTVSRPAESAIQPICIRFEDTVEDQETCIRGCMENEESAFEYVEAVLLASDLNWHEFEKRWLSSVQILDASLFDEVEIFSSRPLHDQRLLFDSANVTLKQVCDRYLGLRRNVQPVPRGMGLINEVWERIESDLLARYPQSLDQLVKRDLGVSGAWMDLCCETREMVMEIDDLIFEDMMHYTLLTLLDDDEEEENKGLEAW